MKGKVCFDDLKTTPYLLAKNEIIHEVGYSFSSLTGYSDADVLKRSLSEVLKKLLRANDSLAEIQNADNGKDTILFTKSYEPRQIAVQVYQGQNFDETVYAFTEKPNSRLEDKILFLKKFLIDNKLGVAIYSIPDYILLKSNNKYLDYIYNRVSMNGKLEVKGYDKYRECCIGRQIKDFIPNWNGSRAEKVWMGIVKTNETLYITERKGLLGEGDERYWDNTLMPIDEDGEVKYIVSILEDVTERVYNRIRQEETTSREVTERVEYLKLMEAHQQLLLKAEIEKNKNLESEIKMKDEFLSFISHEFKTPLTVINSAVQAIELLCEQEMTDKLRGFISKIKQNSFRQLRLVNNLLDITRLNAGRIKIENRNMDIVMITRAITESVKLYSDQKGINLTFTSAIEHKIIGIDEEKYERIMLNLLSNAIKFTPKGKSITVRLSCIEDNVCINIKDEGVGIPKDKLKLIFERFEQVENCLSSQSQGTGIGLFLVRLLAEAMGGSISVDSKINEGSTFTVLIPSIKAEEREIKRIQDKNNDNRIIYSSKIEFSDIYLN